MAIRARISPWLTYAECIDISIRKLTRQPRMGHQPTDMPLFAGEPK